MKVKYDDVGRDQEAYQMGKIYSTNGGEWVIDKWVTGMW